MVQMARPVITVMAFVKAFMFSQRANRQTEREREREEKRLPIQDSVELGSSEGTD